MKYLQGGGNRSKKPRKGRHFASMVDIGEGYDETDPFIDNAEAVSYQK